MDRTRLHGGEETLYRKLVRVAVPIAAQSLIASSLSLVDNLMVGRLGEAELAAVGLSSQFNFIFWMVLFGFTGGTITYMAQFFGKGDMASIRRVTGIAVTVSFAFGVAFFCISFFAPEKVLGIFTNVPSLIEMGRPFVRLSAFIYLTWSIVVPLTAALKATQQTHVPLKISIVVFSLNTVLCLVLIYGLFGNPKMGIMGAAAATVISRCVELIIYIVVIFGRRNVIAGPLRDFFGWTRELFMRVLANALPTMGNEALWAAGAAMYNAAYGRISTDASLVEASVAAAQAGSTIFNLFSLVCFSIGDAMLILCGEKLGHDEPEEAFLMASRIRKIAVLTGAVLGGVMIAVSGVIVKLFEMSPLGEGYTRWILVVFGIFLFAKAHNATIVTGALRAGGDTRMALIIDIGTVWLIGVPLAFVGALALDVPVHVIVLMVQAEEIVKIFLTRRRFLSKIWTRDLVKNL